jgi:hypothetical protein
MTADNGNCRPTMGLGLGNSEIWNESVHMRNIIAKDGSIFVVVLHLQCRECVRTLCRLFGTSKRPEFRYDITIHNLANIENWLLPSNLIASLEFAKGGKEQNLGLLIPYPK